jgi:hypothetical protein
MIFLRCLDLKKLLVYCFFISCVISDDSFFDVSTHLAFSFEICSSFLSANRSNPSSCFQVFVACLELPGLPKGPATQHSEGQ